MDGRIIYILRHGKAEDSHSDGDYYRALAASGEADIRAAAQALVNAPAPSRIIASAATRAAQTAGIVATHLAVAEEKQTFERQLYFADVDDWLAQLGALDDATAVVLLVGHNPTLSALAQTLGGISTGLPPGGLIALRHEGDWQSVGKCQFIAAHYPADKQSKLPPDSDSSFFAG